MRATLCSALALLVTSMPAAVAVAGPDSDSVSGSDSGSGSDSVSDSVSGSDSDSDSDSVSVSDSVSDSVSVSDSGSGSSSAPPPDPDRFPGWSYFTDIDVVVFVYGTNLMHGAIELVFDPPSSPRLFPEDEGGATSTGQTVPEVYVGIGGVALATLLFAPHRPGRWYHLRGMAQAVSTVLFITSIGKNAFGRHRPFFEPDGAGTDQRKSFPSGHSSTAMALGTYGCLYLHRDAKFGWGTSLGCVAIASTATLVAYSRVPDKRHHLTDVLAGGVLGIVGATGFFLWSESRYRSARRERVRLSPWLSKTGDGTGIAGLAGRF